MSSTIGNNTSSSGVAKEVENFSTVNKPNLAKSKKSDLALVKNYHFAKINPFGIDFLTFKDKKIFKDL